MQLHKRCLSVCDYVLPSLYASFLLMAWATDALTLPPAQLLQQQPQQQQLTAADSAKQDHYGTAISLSFPFLSIGAPFADIQTRMDVGAVYMYQYIAFNMPTASPTFTLPITDSWTFMQKLTASDSKTADYFGYSLSLSVSKSSPTSSDLMILVVGAPYADVAGLIDVGAAYIFRYQQAIIIGFNQPNLQPQILIQLVLLSLVILWQQ